MNVKRIYNKYLPFKGFISMAFCPWIFIREDKKKKYTSTVNRHEMTHILQQIGTLWILFFVVYVLEWLIKIPFCNFNTAKAYRSVSFEQEAFANQGNVKYNKERKHYAWVKYIFKTKEKQL